jgi:L-threonylcarbamoyladenylate synthase
MLKLSVEEARPLIAQGSILAYPTEAIYGLGCDPFNQKAVDAIYQLKGREAHKACIVLISNWAQLFSLITPISQTQLAQVKATWPGFVTWVFFKSPELPSWLGDAQGAIAIRMSAHPIAHALSLNNPIISTSANLSGHPPAKTVSNLIEQFPKGIDAVVQGSLGDAQQPSPIFDVRNGQLLR